ncbi:hypothetical protein [Actinomyces ruminicola]|uniref:hypothetical protein n=1 Tax=Actinomyces ruminicola TaxID=332524 RepID=UPI0011CC7F9E|nr:hypothetical protein [Actinomyces ruminicola]
MDRRIPGELGVEGDADDPLLPLPLLDADDAPAPLLERMRPLCVPVSGIVQDAMTRFLAQDGLRRHVARAPAGAAGAPAGGARPLRP